MDRQAQINEIRKAQQERVANAGNKFASWHDKRALRKSKGLALYDAGEMIGHGVNAVINLTLLTKAVRAAKREDWGKAQAYGILWVGFSHNISNAHAQRQRQRAHRLPSN